MEPYCKKILWIDVTDAKFSCHSKNCSYSLFLFVFKETANFVFPQVLHFTITFAKKNLLHFQHMLISAIAKGVYQMTTNQPRSLGRGSISKGCFWNLSMSNNKI